MKWIKRLGMIGLLGAMLVLPSACSIPNGAEQQQVNRWLQEAKLDAVETPQQLYEAARSEGTLVVYSITSRIFEVKKSFEQQYPGLTVEIRDIRSNDLVNLLKDEAKSGALGCDLIVYADGDAMLSCELIPQGLLHKYVPPDMADMLLPQSNTDQLQFLWEVQQLIYNSEQSEAPPISNWWELTEPRFYGRVYASTPLRSAGVMGAMLTIVQHGDELSEAYESLYGKPLEIPPGSSAGEVYFEALFNNGLVVFNSADEVAQAVGQPGQTEPAVGIAISSKLRLQELGYNLRPAYGIEPFDGVCMPNSVMLAQGSRQVNTAKLFVRWLLGEADGQGAGYKPYRTEGTWSCRTDVQGGSMVPLASLDLLTYDKPYIYAEKERFAALWTKWSDMAGTPAPQQKEG